MRSQGQIRHQVKQVTFRHLKKRLRDLFKQRPDTCTHNVEFPLDDTSSVHLCGFMGMKGKPRHIPCDDRIPGCSDMARSCPFWEPLKTKAEVKDEFHALIQGGDRGLIASQFPDLAALMWVLDDPNEVPSVREVEEAIQEADESSDEDEEPEPATWLSGLVKKLGGRW